MNITLIKIKLMKLNIAFLNFLEKNLSFYYKFNSPSFLFKTIIEVKCLATKYAVNNVVIIQFQV